jgi:hypothetical protein
MNVLIKISDFKLTNFKKFNNEYVIVEKDEKFGLIDKTGKLKINCEFTFINKFKDEYLIAENYNEHEFTCYDKNFQEKFKIKANSCGNFHENLAWIENKGKYGYINTKGEIVIDYLFGKAGNFGNGYAWVKNEGNEFALINEKGEIVIDYFYADDIKNCFNIPFISKHAILINNNENGIKEFDLLEINASLEARQPTVFNDEPFQNIHVVENSNTAVVKSKDRWFIYDLNEEEIISQEFDFITDDILKIGYEDSIEPFINSTTAFVQKNNKFGLINLKGELISDIKYDSFRPFFNNNACVAEKNDGKLNWGIINESGKMICELKYFDVANFNEGYGGVCKKFGTSYRWAFVDKNGKEITDFIYLNSSLVRTHDAIKFSEGKCCVQIQDNNSNLWQIINKKFEVINQLDLDEAFHIYPYFGNFAKVLHIEKNKIGFINTAGDLIKKIEYKQDNAIELIDNDSITLIIK